MFEEKIKELYTKLEKTGVMVVATSALDYVSARSLSTVFYDGKLYFQTDKNFITFKQLEENPNVALCINNIQIDGKVKLIGPTIGCPIIEDLYKKKHNNSYNSYSHLPTTQMMEVTLLEVRTWVYRDGQPYQCWYNFTNKEYKESQYVEVKV